MKGKVSLCGICGGGESEIAGKTATGQNVCQKCVDAIGYAKCVKCENMTTRKSGCQKCY